MSNARNLANLLGTATSVPSAKMPAGSVIQTVNSTKSGAVSSTSQSSYTDTGLTATITPLISTSKILVHFSQAGCNASNSGTDIDLILLRGSTNIASLAGLMLEGVTTGNLTLASHFLDSPSTTSATTYKTQFRIGDDAGTVTVQYYGTSVMTLMEIAQ